MDCQDLLFCCEGIGLISRKLSSAGTHESMLLALLVSYVALTSALQIGTPFASQAAPSARLACRTRHPDVVCGRKGRPKMPGGGGAFAQPQQRQPEPSPDGMPNFYLYCRSGPGKPWYPVSMMKGDGQSKGLINAWLGSPVAKVCSLAPRGRRSTVRLAAHLPQRSPSPSIPSAHPLRPPAAVSLVSPSVGCLQE